MSNEAVQVLVVGGGQAGLAMSEHLRACGLTHLVLERHRIAERWRSERWDSLVANGPAWHDRFPGLEFDLDPDAFASKEQVAEYFEAYAREDRGADPLRGRGARRCAGTRAGPASGPRRRDGTIEARYVVAATGPFQRPLIPPILPDGRGRRADPLERLPQPGPAARRRGPRRRGGVVRRADRGRAAPLRAERLPLRRARTTVPRGATAAATSAGGSACSTSGMRRRRSPAPRTSRSRSAGRTAATPSTSATSNAAA